jgi:TonB family protein
MRRALAIVCAGLFLFGEWLFACEKEPLDFQAAAMSNRIVKRTPLVLQGLIARIEGTINLRVVVGEDGRPSCISVVRGHPILTSSAIASVKEWRFRPYRKNRKLVDVFRRTGAGWKEFARPDYEDPTTTTPAGLPWPSAS